MNNSSLPKAVFPTLILLALVGIFWPLFTGPAEFIGDDYYFIVDNPRVTTLSLAALADIWTKPMKVEYFPVTISSYFLEHSLWGGTAKLYRMTNLLLFLAIGYLSYRLTCLLTVCRFGERFTVVAGLTVCAMALHPANVETVAAIANRKELLYVLFGLLALISYISDADNPRKRYLALLFVVLAQLSKGSAVILPILLAVYELSRSTAGKDFLRRLCRLVPFAVVTAVGFAVQFSIAVKAGVVAGSDSLTLATRIGGVIRTMNAMLSTLLMPRAISYDYDLPWPAGLPPWQEWLLPCGLIAGLVVLVCLRRSRELFVYSILALAPLLPYLNIIPLGHTLKGQMVFYDHYLFFTLMLLPLVLTTLAERLPPNGCRLFCACLGIIAALYAGYDFVLSGFWKTRESLYTRLIQTSPNLPKGHFFLGGVYLDQGRYPLAIQQLNAVFGSKDWYPEFINTHLLLGDAYCFSGEYRRGIDQYRLYLTHKPGYLKAIQNLSTALLELKEYDQARRAVTELLAQYPDDPIGLRNQALLQQAGLK